MELPDHVRALLWEYDSSWLGEDAGVPDAVIERTMVRGGLRQIRWLLDTVDHEVLVDYLRRRGRRVLGARDLRFWSWAAGVPEQEAARWLAEARVRKGPWWA